MKSLQTFFLLFMVFLSSCIGQVPDAAKENFDQKYTGAENVKWELDKNGFFEAKFEMEGKKYRADYDRNGIWIETENNIEITDLPEPVLEVLQAEYGDPKIVEIEWVDNAEKGIFFDVEIRTIEGKRDIMFRQDGTVIK